MCKPLLKELYFRIGEQYELHEFDLVEEAIKLIGNYEYDVYSCNSDLFERIKTDGLINILLYYNGDILARVDYQFQSNCISDVIHLFTPSKNEDIITFRYLNDVIEIVVTHSKYLR